MGKVIILLTVDWEGEDINSISDLVYVRRNIGYDIPLTHFICPTYFLNNKRAGKQIKKVITSSDEVAVHIHPLKELTNYLNIDFRTSRNFFEPEMTKFTMALPKRIQQSLRPKVSGRGVPISVYNKEEIQQLIKGSIGILKNNLQVNNIVGFRAGGNMASDSVLESVSESNLLYDSSAMPPEILSQHFSPNTNGDLLDNYHDTNGKFTEYVIRLWGYNNENSDFLKNIRIKQCNPLDAITLMSQPFKIDKLWEFPINGGMSDFATPQKTFIPALNKLIEISKSNTSDSYLNLGFHLEGDFMYKMSIIKFIKKILSNSSDSVEFSTIAQEYRKICCNPVIKES